MDEKEKPGETNADSSALYYGIGAAVLVLLVAGIYLLRPKPNTSTPSGTVQGATGSTLARPTGQITGLACEMQYYNPVIGLKQYYLSAEGSDVTEAKSVNCDFSVVVAKKEVAKQSATADLKDEPSRGGKTFRCTSPALSLDPNVPTVVNIALADDLKKTATCTATFLLPTP